ncbi:MAG: hypothetical protein RLZZ306_2240 [Bacteroidota bacterium]|jgi:hypothetical protein
MKKLPFYLLLCFQAISCSLYRPFSSQVKSSEIKNIGLLPSIGVVQLISTKKDDDLETQNTIFNFSQRLSDGTSINVEEVLNFVNVPFKRIKPDLEENKALDNELERYLKIMSSFSFKNSDGIPEILKTKKSQLAFENIIISDSVVNLIKKDSQRFALAVLVNGNTRTQNSDLNRKLKNTASQVLGFGVAAFTGFGFYTKEMPYNTTTYIFILDSQTKKLAMFRAKNEIIDPMNNQLVKQQLYSAFEDYWVWYHPEAQKFLKLNK